MILCIYEVIIGQIWQAYYRYDSMNYRNNIIGKIQYSCISLPSDGLSIGIKLEVKDEFTKCELLIFLNYYYIGLWYHAIEILV